MLLSIFFVVFSLNMCLSTAWRPINLMKPHGLVPCGKQLIPGVSLLFGLFLSSSNPLRVIASESTAVNENVYDFVSSTSEESRVERKLKLLKEKDGRPDTS